MKIKIITLFILMSVFAVTESYADNYCDNTSDPDKCYGDVITGDKGQVSRMYQKLVNKGYDSKEIEKSDTAWVNLVNSQCRDNACVSSSYSDRITYLAGLLNN